MGRCPGRCPGLVSRLVSGWHHLKTCGICQKTLVDEFESKMHWCAHDGACMCMSHPSIHDHHRLIFLLPPTS